jgi:mono/diheme cytochrome c family protein
MSLARLKPSRYVVVLVWALFVAMASALVVVACASNDGSHRGMEYMPDMAYSVPYNSFAANPVTRDGKTLQTPVPGTVPRGFQPYRYAATPDEALRAGRELSNPILPSPEALAQGRALYETFCLVCHGEQGRGDGPLVPKIPNPPAYTSARVRAMAPGQIFHVISRGSGRMPSYAAQIPYEQRWRIVLYVGTLREGPVIQP